MTDAEFDATVMVMFNWAGATAPGASIAPPRITRAGTFGAGTHRITLTSDPVTAPATDATFEIIVIHLPTQIA